LKSRLNQPANAIFMTKKSPSAPASKNPITSQLGQSEPRYLKGLNEEQKSAVLTTEGPLLALAGAGTGKTRVLTTRIAHILASNKARSFEILSVTFTNKAAREMKERVANLVGSSIEGMTWLGTFHSIGAKMLRRHAELVGLKPDFTILDADDQVRLLKQLMSVENLDEKRWPARQLAAMIDGWKNRGLLPRDITAAEAGMFANGKAQQLYEDYQKRLKTLNAADFGDLLLECISLFRQNPDVLAQYHKRFKYLLVDEYQDSNVAQYLWLRLLAQGQPAEKANICVVGDDDQSIYGWRGAEVDNILRFEKDFPGAKTVRLERNYRSTSNILLAASNLIAHNETRLGKTLQTDVGETGEKISVISVWDSEEEARQLGEEIEQFQRAGENLNSMAILVRTSAQMRSFEERFITLGLNYRIIGGARFYERREIRDALAYLRITAQNADDLAFERIVNVPKRGLGSATIKILHETARAQNMPILATTRQLLETDELGSRQRTTLRSLITQIDDWADRSRTLPQNELAEAILDESGYTAMWQNEKTADAPGRLENLKELVKAMEDFTSLGGFLEHISLVMDRDASSSDDAVSIMTLHSAKGLEFNTVFLPGWEDGLFPSQRSLDENGRVGLEEERRLAYVGITRARKRAKISLAQNRRTHGLWQTALPSRFLDELPAEVVEVTDTGSSYGGYNYGGGNSAQKFDSSDPFETNYDTPGWKRMQARRQTRQENNSNFSNPKYNAPKTIAKTIEGELVSRSVNIDSSSSFSTGQKILHLKFGEGEILGVEGNKLTIVFATVGRKKVLESFIKRA